MSLFQDLSATRSNNRSARNDKVEGTSPKQFVLLLGNLTPSGKTLPDETITSLLREVMGVKVVRDKGHICGKGEVKIGTVRQWYRWGHPDFPPETPKRGKASKATSAIVAKTRLAMGLDKPKSAK